MRQTKNRKKTKIHQKEIKRQSDRETDRQNRGWREGHK